MNRILKYTNLCSVKVNTNSESNYFIRKNTQNSRRRTKLGYSHGEEKSAFKRATKAKALKHYL